MPYIKLPINWISKISSYIDLYTGKLIVGKSYIIMILQIYTPEKKVFEGDIQKATFPGSSGSFQVLKNHADLISLLTTGTVFYNEKDGHESSFVLPEGGCVEVSKNIIKILAW